MPRATNAPASRKRRKRMLKKASGYRGSRSKLYRVAKDAVYKAQTWAYRDRKNRKRTFRNLWVQRINAGVRDLALTVGGDKDGKGAKPFTYSRLIEGLVAAEIEIDRKVLSDMAIHYPSGFKAVAEAAHDALSKKLA
ncbi:MAG: 50S ribosomal protein L20 [Verrucomicrobiota bacterium]